MYSDDQKCYKTHKQQEENMMTPENKDVKNGER